METEPEKGFAKGTAIEEPRHHSLTSPTPPVLGGKKLKSPFQNACLRKTASLHLFPCCGKSTRTGFDPKQGQLQNVEILQPGRTPPSSLSTFDFNYMGTCLGWGLLPELSWPRWRGPCAVAQKSFLKVHAGSLSCCQSCTFSLARFLALLGQSNAKALSCSSLCVC